MIPHQRLLTAASRAVAAERAAMLADRAVVYWTRLSQDPGRKWARVRDREQLARCVKAAKAAKVRLKKATQERHAAEAAWAIR